MRLAMLATFFTALVAAAPAAGQQLDARWTPWLGCWQLDRQPVRVCVSPLDDARGVTLRTYVDDEASDKAVLEQTLVADGARQQVEEAECRGYQAAEWSRAGDRLFARAELTCSDGAARTVSGLSMIAGDGTWVDVQGITVAGHENVRVRRYRRASGGRADVRLKPDATYGSLAPRLGAAFSLEDVKEAAARLSPRVVEAALVEAKAGFNLSSRALRDLQRAGVGSTVIDAMVALSYPGYFVVERPDRVDSSAAFAPVSLGDFGTPWMGGLGYPYDSAYAYGSPYYSPYFYAPFGYAYWASMPYGTYLPYLPAAGFVIDRAEPEGDGRAVDGVGYTRIRERDAAERSGGSDGTATSGPRTTGGSSTPWGGGGDVSGASPGGYSGGSSGGSGGDSGRTAQPR